MTSIETLIRSANPAPKAEISEPNSLEAVEILERVLEEGAQDPRAPAFRRGVLTVVAVAAAVTLIIAIVLSGGTSPSPSAAASLLIRAARVAEAQPALPPLVSGQYYYQKTVLLQSCTLIGTSPAEPLVYLTPMTVETWTTSDGSGTERKSPLGPGHFETSEQATDFAQSHQPGGCLQPTLTESLPAATPNEPGITNLPTDPAALGSLIAAGRVNDVGQVSPSATTCPSRNGDAPQIFETGEVCSVSAQFDIVNNLLETPTASARLGPALFQILSQLPGIKIMGTETDSLGRTGTAVEDPSSGDVIVFSQSTGMLLQIETLATQTTKPSVSVGSVLSSTSYGPVTVVGSDGALPK